MRGTEAGTTMTIANSLSRVIMMLFGRCEDQPDFQRLEEPWQLPGAASMLLERRFSQTSMHVEALRASWYARTCQKDARNHPMEG